MHITEKTDTMRVPLRYWGHGVEIESEALDQMRRICALPFIHRHAALMPDAHAGIGGCVGAVVATRGAVIPAVTGVDLGCGMMALRTNLTASDLPDSLGAVRSAIEAAVPHGRTDNGGRNDRGAWGEIPEAVGVAWVSLGDRFRAICDKHPAIAKTNNVGHLGTLGTGNHFIEVCLDEAQSVWAMLHSGSRGVGGRIGSYFIDLAKKDMKRWFIDVPHSDLAYFPEGTDHFDDYVEAVSWAQDFARRNRELMMRATIDAISVTLGRTVHGDEQAVNCHHNYIAREHHYGDNVLVTRKGAVCAREGMLGIIPGSMGAKSFIVRGKGNAESFHSCSHGAGRRMSRTAAKKLFTLDDHAKAVEGVECRRDADVIDETPAAYKSIDAVMAAQADLVDVVHTLKQVVCVKG